MKRQAEAEIPTPYGTFQMIAYAETPEDNRPHIALVSSINTNEIPLVRVHSECLTGDIFASARCDCGEQLHAALLQIGKEGGALIYLRQEGRGIGLINKLKAYQLQDKGFDTAEANVHLGFDIDERDYTSAKIILDDLNITQVRLMTNNPDKIDSLKNNQIDVVERIPVIIEPNDNNIGYLQTKQTIMGHLLNIK